MLCACDRLCTACLIGQLLRSLAGLLLETHRAYTGLETLGLDALLVERDELLGLGNPICTGGLGVGGDLLALLLCSSDGPVLDELLDPHRVLAQGGAQGLRLRAGSRRRLRLLQADLRRRDIVALFLELGLVQVEEGGGLASAGAARSLAVAGDPLLADLGGPKLLAADECSNTLHCDTLGVTQGSALESLLLGRGLLSGRRLTLDLLALLCQPPSGPSCLSVLASDFERVLEDLSP